jgi:transcriptional regulator with XRE-family HTH domain
LPGGRRSRPDPIDVAVGARIRLRRRLLNLTQKQLAEKIGVTFQQIQKYESGGNRVATSTMVKIAAVLRTSVAALVGEGVVSPFDPTLYGQLEITGADRLLKLYEQIESGELRQALVTTAEALARMR